jgi:hypothetical protein
LEETVNFGTSQDDGKQCDQTFHEKNRPILSKIAKNGALLNKIFYLWKLIIKIWKFKDRSSQNLELI